MENETAYKVLSLESQMQRERRHNIAEIRHPITRPDMISMPEEESGK